MSNKIFQISEVELFDYLRCPVYYQALHKKRLPFKNMPSFNTLLNRVASSFYLNLMDGRILPISTLKKKWDTICEQYMDIITPQKCLKGMGLLQKLYIWAEKEELRIADTNIPYVVSFNGKRSVVEVKGEIGTVGVMKSGLYELLITDFSPKYPDQAAIDFRLKYTLDAYAFQLLFQKQIGVHIHHVETNKDFYTFRGRDDFKRLASSIDNIAFSMQNKLYYPRENVLCPSCEMKDFCKLWTD